MDILLRKHSKHVEVRQLYICIKVKMNLNVKNIENVQLRSWPFRTWYILRNRATNFFFFFQYCHLYSVCESTLPKCKVFLQKRTKTFRHLASKRFLRSKYFTPNFRYGKSIYLSVFFKICCIPGN